MSTTIRARVRNGKIEPLEAVELPEGAELEVVIISSPEDDHLRDLTAFRSSFGGWKGLLDVEAFLRDLRESRKLSRPEPRL